VQFANFAKALINMEATLNQKIAKNLESIFKASLPILAMQADSTPGGEPTELISMEEIKPFAALLLISSLQGRNIPDMELATQVVSVIREELLDEIDDWQRHFNNQLTYRKYTNKQIDEQFADFINLQL
jgi:hypothetical protein